MPHIHIEYSQNLVELVNMGKLCEAVRTAAVEIDAFPLAGIRVRAVKVEHFAIADGSAKHGFVDISVRLREGRTMEVKQDALHVIFEAVKAFFMPVMSTHSIALSAEIRDINADLSLKFGTIRDHLEDNA